MPFRLELELKSKASRALWTKSIAAFYTIADNFKIDIRQGTETGVDEYGRNCYSEIVFTSTNKTRTTVMCISFKECFFKKFQIDGEISDRGTRGEKNGNQINFASSYTMIVSSKDMNILFKDCADDSVLWKIFMLSGDEITQMVYSNKLFVEFDTKSGMKKRYSISYRPSGMTYDNKIQYIYLKFLENQQKLDNGEDGDGIEDDDDDGIFDDDDDEDDDRVHRIAMDTNIFKRFLQMFPFKLEDMKIEVNPKDGMISFRGYNRQQIITKDDSIFKKPMTLAIKMRLSSIIYNNIKERADDKKLQVSYRLRNFKTFIQVINFNYTDFKDYSEEEQDSVNPARQYSSHVPGVLDEGGNVCDIMFSKPGYPIIFERRYFIDEEHDVRECCSVTLTEVTDGEAKKISIGGLEAGIDNRVVDLGLPTMRGTNLKRKRDGSDVTPSVPAQVMEDTPVGEPLFVADDYNDDYGRQLNGANDAEINGNEKSYKNATNGFIAGVEISDGGDGGDGSDDEDGYLGPTQREQIKGIFD